MFMPFLFWCQLFCKEKGEEEMDHKHVWGRDIQSAGYRGEKKGDHSESLRTFTSNRERRKKRRKEQESGILTMEAAEDHREISLQ